MTVQKIIQESIAGNPLQMKEALAEELRSRVRLALEAKMDDSNGDDSSEDENDDDDDDDVKKEEAEQIDEISGATLGSYYVKASADRKKHLQGASKAFSSGISSKDDIQKAQAEYDKHNSRVNKRLQGMNNAMNKLTGSSFARVHAKEEFELEDFTVEELEAFMESAEFEQLDELSKKTLASYVSKAADHAASKGMEHGAKKAQADEMDRVMNRHMSYSDKDKVRQIMKTTSKDVDEPREKAAKRLRGIDRAVKRLAK